MDRRIRRPANSTSSRRFSLPRLTESDFNQRLERELERQVDRIAKHLSAPEQKALTRIRHKVVKTVLDLNPWEHVKHVLIEHGKGAAVTAAVTEIITVGILPAILTATGMTGAAAFSAGSPSFAVTVPAFIAWKKWRQRKKLANELGFNNLGELDKLRKEILGFCTSKRLVSKVYEAAEGEVEINVIKRRFANWRERPTGNIIDLVDLERIAKTSLEKRTLEIIKPLKKEDPSVYATVLIDQIQRHPLGSSNLSTFIKNNMGDMPYQLSNNQQDLLLKVHEKEKHISRLKMDIRKLKSSINKEARSQGIDKESRKAVTEFSENLITDLETLEMDIKRFEYSFLYHLNLGETVTEESVEESSFILLNRMRTLESVYRKQKMVFDSLETLEEIDLKQVIAKMKTANASWKPYATGLEGDGNCANMTSRYLMQSKITVQ